MSARAILPVLLAALAAMGGAGAGALASEPEADLVARGAALFADNCAACHGRGIGNPGADMHPGTAALTAKYNGRLPGLLEERTDLTPQIVELFVRNGVSVMAPYRRTEISDEELAAIGAYLSRNNPNLARERN